MAGAEAAPEAILWCDPGRDFEPIIPALRQRLPQLLTLGKYDPATRAGPAVWLRAAAGQHVEGLYWDAGIPPIIWMPNVTREIVRGAEDCEPALQPLVWYAVAGVFFGQPKQSRDWTLRGFLSAQGSPLGLDIPEDAATRASLARAARVLFSEQVEALKGRRWDAASLDALLAPDPVQDMLRWIDGGLTESSDPERFAAFAARATKDFGLDPRKKSRQDAATRLAQRSGSWLAIWERFEQTESFLDGVVNLLRNEEPSNLFAYDFHYPRVNERRETELRNSLLSLDKLGPAEARDTIGSLEREHGDRRASVWAKRGEARLAFVLRELSIIAEAAALPDHDPSAMAEAYVAAGWKSDAAVMRALDLARTGSDRDAAIVAIRSVYLPWLEQAATGLQALAYSGSVPFARPVPQIAPRPEDALLFVDGLRMDLAQTLVSLLRAKGVDAKLKWQWSGFPTVTATCKPLTSPAAILLTGGEPIGLYPDYQGKPASKPTLYKAIEAAGWSTQATLLAEKPSWNECGRFDEEGHARGSRLAESIPDALQEVADKASNLAREGRRVRIVTDHGWLLVPGGLDHAPLHSGLIEPSQKGSRVALLKEGAPTSYTRLPWTWDASVSFAIATGARAFLGGKEYAHGGVSPQECVLAVIDISAETLTKPLAINASWKRLRLKVEVPGGAGLMLDVRRGLDTSGASVLKNGPRTLDDFGQVGVLISDEYDGEDVCLVVHPPGSPQDVRAKFLTSIRADEA